MRRDHKSGTLRRRLLAGGLGAMGAGLVAQVGAAQQPTKLAKNVVMYQDNPKGDQKCSICAHFLPPNACQIVAGDISPNGWCGVFLPKQT